MEKELETIILQNHEMKQDTIKVLEAIAVQNFETNKEMKNILKSIKDYKPTSAKDMGNEALNSLMSSLKDLIDQKKIKTKLGIKDGEDGKTPIKGKDYFTTDELKEIMSELQKKIKEEIETIKPIKGKDYFTKQEIDEIKQAVKPIKGKDYFDGLNGLDADEDKIIKEVTKKIPTPKKGDKGDKGDNGSPDTPAEIVSKLESIKKENEKLSPDAISNLSTYIKRFSAQTPDEVDLSNYYNKTETDNRFLKLDQTTQQTLINGIPLLEATRTIDSDNQLVDKKYVDDAIGIENLWDRTGTTLTTHFADDDVNIGGDITANNLTGTNTGDQDLSGYIPYTGATNDVNLGSQDLTATDIIATGNISGSNLSGTNTGDQDLSGLVPYTGATTNVDLGSHTFRASNIGIGVAPTSSKLYIAGDTGGNNKIIDINSTFSNLSTSTITGNAFTLNIYNSTATTFYGNQYSANILGTSAISNTSIFYVRPYMQSSGNLNSLITFTTDPYFWTATCSGAVNTVVGISANGGAYGGGATSVITNWKQININNPTTSANIVNNYGLYIRNIYGATNSNYAIYSEGGDIYLAGETKLGSQLKLANLSSAPSTPQTGAIYFNTSDSHFYGYNGSSWVQLD